MSNTIKWTRGVNPPSGGIGFSDYAYLDGARKLLIGRPDALPPVVIDVKETQGTTAISYNPDGSIASVNNGSSTKVFQYNVAGQLTSVSNGLIGGTKTLNYDSEGVLQSVTIS